MAEYTLRFSQFATFTRSGVRNAETSLYTHATGCVHAPAAYTHLALAYTHPLRIRTLILVRYTAARVYYSTHPDRGPCFERAQAVSQSVSYFTVPPRAHPSTGSQASNKQNQASKQKKETSKQVFIYLLQAHLPRHSHYSGVIPMVFEHSDPAPTVA